jgi:hypothetical protein
MPGRTILARSIARPLLEDLTAQPFSGQVLGRFRRACNLIDDRKRVVALLLPDVGRGPFAIAIDGSPGIFDSLSPGQPARANRQAVIIGRWTVLLRQAAVWEPRLVRPLRQLNTDLIIDLLEPYAHWPNFVEDTSTASRMAQAARQRVAQFLEVITEPDRESALMAVVERLAGLGSGLTPAGDDYLLGAMAALWLAGRPTFVPLIARTAWPKTNALSGAFLQAAARGEFMEPWHALARSWQAEDKAALAAAVQWIADFGASSGRDALAGFSNVLLKLAGQPMAPNR